MTRPSGALTCAILLTTFAAAAHAQAPPPVQIPGAPPPGERRPPPRDEHGPPHERLFISPSGQPFRTADGLGAWLAQADADHDGAVSREEFRADAEAWFKVLDANHDGRIDGFEITAYEHEIVPEITLLGDGERPGGDRPAPSGGGRGRDGGGMGRGGGGMGRGGGMGGGGRHGGGDNAQSSPANEQPRMQAAGRQGASRFSLVNEPEPVLAADTDIDGRVSHEEWMKATSRRFDLLDKAHAGKLSRDSLVPPKPDRK